MAKEILCAFGVHVDAVSGWLGSYGGEESPADISRGMFAGEVGVPRLLELFGRGYQVARAAGLRPEMARALRATGSHYRSRGSASKAFDTSSRLSSAIARGTYGQETRNTCPVRLPSTLLA